MDLTGQGKKYGMPSSFVYNPQLPPSKISPPPPPQIVSTTGGGGGEGERRRDGTGNGTSIFTSSQNLDHHYHFPQHLTPTPIITPNPTPIPLSRPQPQPQPQPQQQPQPPPPPPPPQQPEDEDSDSDSDSDPVPVSIAISGSPIPPIGVGSNSNPRTPTTVRSGASSVRYRECLKNHAASIGGQVVDGCGEFMPTGEEGTPEALKCAACECHRNFHRKEVEGELQASANCYYYYNNIANTSRSTRNPPPPSLPAHPSALLASSHHKFPLGTTSPTSGPIAPLMMAFGGGGTTESSSEELNAFQSHNAGGVTGPGHAQPPQYSFSKKRFRTKFSQEQKEKMMEFAEKIGWRMQKQDETLIQNFCAEAGVKRQVLKVWMHNNKHSMKKKEEM